MNCYNSYTSEYYSPFGMVTPGRSFAAGSGYRFGFNGQEQVDEVYGNGNLNTAQYWEYDTRLGRRWNLDPIVNSSLSSYSTFYNQPIIISDVDGDCGCGCPGKPPCPMGKISKFEYTGTWTDVFAAFDNAVINIVNTVPELINSAAANVNSIQNGTWTNDISTEATQMATNVANFAVGSWNYTWSTPLDQQAVDTWNFLSKPTTWELGFTFYLTTKLPILSESIAEASTTSAARASSTRLIVTEEMPMLQKVDIRKQLANDYFEKYSINKKYLEGIDYSVPVQTTIIPEGAILTQWRRIGDTSPSGIFYTIGEDASTLGINPLYYVKEFKVKVTTPTKALMSTAADIDDWIIPGTINKGGGVQFISTEIQSNSIVIQ